MGHLKKRQPDVENLPSRNQRPKEKAGPDWRIDHRCHWERKPLSCRSTDISRTGSFLRRLVAELINMPRDLYPKPAKSSMGKPLGPLYLQKKTSFGPWDPVATSGHLPKRNELNSCLSQDAHCTANGDGVDLSSGSMPTISWVLQ